MITTRLVSVTTSTSETILRRLLHPRTNLALELDPEDLGFMVVCDGSIGLARKSPKKRGRPRGSKNKKMTVGLNYDSMASFSGIAGMSKGDGEQQVAKPEVTGDVAETSGGE